MTDEKIIATSSVIAGAVTGMIVGCVSYAYLLHRVGKPNLGIVGMLTFGSAFCAVYLTATFLMHWNTL